MIEAKLDNYIKNPHTIPDKKRYEECLNSFLVLVLEKHNKALFNALFYRIRLRMYKHIFDEQFWFLLYFCSNFILKRGINLKVTKYRLSEGIIKYPETTFILVSQKEIWTLLSDDNKLDAIIYIDITGCQWRNLPLEYPKWQIVYYYFRAWGADDEFKKMLAILVEQVRIWNGQSPIPAIGAIDSQSVRSAHPQSEKGIDGNFSN